MGLIFISHVHEEATVAQLVLRFLREFELSAYLSSDYLQIEPGELWFARIIDELKAAKVVLLLFSKHSVGRPWISFEAGWAWGTEKRVIPVCFGGLDKGSIPRPYSSLQAINLRSDYYQLLKGCNHIAGKLPPPPHVTDERVQGLIRGLDEFEAQSRTGAHHHCSAPA